MKRLLAFLALAVGAFAQVPPNSVPVAFSGAFSGGGGGGGGFPFILGSTSILGSSTYLTVTGLTLSAPTITGIATYSGASGGTIDFGGITGSNTISNTGGVVVNVSMSQKISGAITDSAGTAGTVLGTYLENNGSGLLVWKNTTESYLLHIGVLGVSPLAGNTYYFGQESNVLNSTEGRYKVYVPKGGKITYVSGGFYSSGGDGSHSVTVDLLVSNSGTPLSSPTFLSNANPTFFGYYSGAGLTVTTVAGITASGGTISAGDYLEFRMVCSSGMTTMTSIVAWMDVLIEVVTNNQ